MGRNRVPVSYGSNRCLLFVVIVHAGCDKQYSLMRHRRCGKLHDKPSQVLIAIARYRPAIATFCLLHLHSTARLGGGGSSRNITMTFGMEKLEWCGYPRVKHFEDMFIRFDRIHERDRRTDKQADRQTPHDGIDRKSGKDIPSAVAPCGLLNRPDPFPGRMM